MFVFSEPCSWAPVEVNGLSASHAHTMPQASAKGSKGAACAEDSGRAYPLCLRGLHAERVCGLQAGEEPGSLSPGRLGTFEANGALSELSTSHLGELPSAGERCAKVAGGTEDATGIRELQMRFLLARLHKQHEQQTWTCEDCQQIERYRRDVQR